MTVANGPALIHGHGQRFLDIHIFAGQRGVHALLRMPEVRRAQIITASTERSANNS
jgi:hypothetical protein